MERTSRRGDLDVGLFATEEQKEDQPSIGTPVPGQDEISSCKSRSVGEMRNSSYLGRAAACPRWTTNLPPGRTVYLTQHQAVGTGTWVSI
jgi:hypothetical protein